MPRTRKERESEKKAFAVARRYIGNSAARQPGSNYGAGAPLGDTGGRLLFVTDGVNAQPMLQRPIPGEESILWTMGNPWEVAPSGALWGRAKWQLHVLFTLYNDSSSVVSIFDLHSHVYLATGVERPLAMMIHRARLGLAQDNSLLSSGKTIILEPREAEAIDLVLETSLFDTLATTIAFGVHVDYRHLSDGARTAERVPSDNIYLFQHFARSFDQCHFVARNTSSIRARLAQDPNNAELHAFCDELQSFYDFHSSADDLSLPDIEQQRRQEAFLSGDKSDGSMVQPGVQAAKPFDFELLGRECPTAANLLRVFAFFEPSCILPRPLIAEAHYQLSLALYRAFHADAAAQMRKEAAQRGEDQQEDMVQRSTSEIPRCLVSGLIARSELEGLYGQIHSLRDGFEDRNAAVEALVQCGALLRGDAGFVNVPLQIATDVLRQLDPLESRVFGECAFRALETLVPNRESVRLDVALYDATVPHAKACHEHLRELGFRWPEVDSYIHNVADYLLHRGNYRDGVVFWRLAVMAAEDAAKSVESDLSLPKKERDTIAKGFTMVVALDLGYFAENLRLAGNLEEAESVMVRALALYEKHGGPDEEMDRLIALHNLGLIYRDLGKLEDAKSIFSRVVPKLERVTPAAVFAEALEDYGRLLTSLGDAEEGAMLLKRARAIRGESQ